MIAPGGRVNLASVGAKAEVTLGPDDPGVAPRSRGGAVTLSDGSLIDTSGEGGGSIFIRDGEFVMDRSEVRSVSRGSKNGGIVSIEAKQVELRNGARIGTIAMGSGRAGDVRVEADRVSLSGDESPSRTDLPGGIGSVAFDTGDAGAVTVKARDLQVRKGAAISTLTRDLGRAGDVLVEADRVSLADRVPLPTGFRLSNLPGGIGSVAFGSGAAGAVTVKAGDLQMRKGAAISTVTLFGSGRAGNVLVDADRVSLSGDPSLSQSDLPGGIGSATLGNGASGAVAVEAGDLEVRDRAVIGTLTRGSGRGGNVRVEADRVSLSGDGAFTPFFLTGIIAVASFSTGSTGNLTVKSGHLKVRNGARIASAAEEGSTGRAGTVLVEADRVSLSGDQSRFPTDLPGGIGSAALDGDAGAVTVKARDLEVRNRAVIGSTTRGSGRGGKVVVEADRVFLSGPFPTGIGAPPLGNGATGTLTIKAGELQVHNGARISSTTTGPARGGNIFVKADSALLSGDGSPSFTGISSDALGKSAGAGRAGTVTVKVRDLLEVRDGGRITTSTLGDGDAGRINVKGDTIKLANRGGIASASGVVDPDTGQLMIGKGNAGRVSIDAERLDMTGGGSITTTTRGPGRGGAVSVDADRVSLSGDGAVIEALTLNGTGDAGTVTVKARDLLEVRDGGRITTSTLGDGDAGRINVKGDTIKLANRGGIASASGVVDPDTGQLMIGKEPFQNNFSNLCS